MQILTEIEIGVGESLVIDGLMVTLIDIEGDVALIQCTSGEIDKLNASELADFPQTMIRSSQASRETIGAMPR